jgi:hypothetical protein
MKLKTGLRLRSQVDSTEVIVVRLTAEDVDLTCGGHPMIDLKETPAAGLVAKEGLDAGSPLGKRFVDEAGELEVLVTKGGEASLGIGTEPLTNKEAAPLPSSD